MTAQTPASDGPGGDLIERCARAAAFAFDSNNVGPMHDWWWRYAGGRWRAVARTVLSEAASQPPAERTDGVALDEYALTPEPPWTPTSDPETLARRFHDAYERLAPSFGYETREASAKPWAQVPENNRRLMVAVCAEIMAAQPPPPASGDLDAAARKAARAAAPDAQVQTETEEQ